MLETLRLDKIESRSPSYVTRPKLRVYSVMAKSDGERFGRHISFTWRRIATSGLALHRLPLSTLCCSIRRLLFALYFRRKSNGFFTSTYRPLFWHLPNPVMPTILQRPRPSSHLRGDWPVWACSSMERDASKVEDAFLIVSCPKSPEANEPSIQIFGLMAPQILTCPLGGSFHCKCHARSLRPCIR